MKVVFCTTCKGRVKHIEETLPINLRDNPDGVFVVLGYNDHEGLAEYINDTYQYELLSGQLVFYEYKQNVPFHMTHAKNMAHRCGLKEGADVLVNLDADNFAGVGFTAFAEKFFTDNPTSFLWAKMIKGVMPRGIMGRIAVTRNEFLMSGGYDEKFATHSPDDRDFKARLEMLGFSPHEIPVEFLNAIPHSDKLRYKEYPHAEIIDENKLVINPTSGIANFGNSGCGTVYRNSSHYPTEIRPFPTRIFGIGMHKTGTTSLHEALKILGFQSQHWPNAPWARRVYEEMTTIGRSHTLEQDYAISDLPLTLLYKQLDTAYPGSKFILTMRKADKWIKSVERHWSFESNPYRHLWETAPFSHKIHTLLYGRKTFDMDTMLKRYYQHNNDVVKYFKDRSDLLIQNAEEGHGWENLCRFLDCEVPQNTPYPHAFRTVTQ